MHFLATRHGHPGLGALQRRMNRLVDDFLPQFDGRTAGDGVWAPALDISETEDALVIQVELPGVDPKDIEITVSGADLSIRAERTEGDAETGEAAERTWHRVERRQGSPARTVKLPETVDVAKIEAASNHGVLTVTLPKREEVQPRRIEVQGQ